MAEENCQELTHYKDSEVLSELLTAMGSLTTSMSKFQAASMGQSASNEIILLDIENSTHQILSEVRQVASLNSKLKIELEEQRQHVERIESKIESFGKQFELLKKKNIDQRGEIEQLRAQKPPIPSSNSGCTIV